MSEETIKDKVLARVRKMLALANNEAASEGERDNALRMAHAALAKYNLTIGDTDVVEEPRIEGQATISPHPWARALIEGIAQLYFCRTIYFMYRDKRQVHHFIGRQSNVTTAIEMAQFIVKSINREARRGAKDNPYVPGYERAFCKGAAAAVWHRCKAIREAAEAKDAPQASTGTALVLASLYRTELEKNEQEITERYQGRIQKKKDKQRAADYEAFNSGNRYGASLNLHRQVT